MPDSPGYQGKSLNSEMVEVVGRGVAIHWYMTGCQICFHGAGCVVMHRL